MDPLTTSYLILAGVIFLMGFVVVYIIAGKEIMFAFIRRFNPRGADIFVLNNNRQVGHFYKEDTDGVFRIKKKLYITNPHKLESLTPEMLIEVSRSLDRRRKRIEKNLKRFKDKKDLIIKQLEAVEDTQQNAPMITQLEAAKQSISDKIATLEQKIEVRAQSYFMNRRPTYFYIENDPVPKDLFEFYTEFDSIMIDNIIARSMTKDPKAGQDMLEQILFLKKLLFASLIIGGIAAWFAFQNSSALEQAGFKAATLIST